MAIFFGSKIELDFNIVMDSTHKITNEEINIGQKHFLRVINKGPEITDCKITIEDIHNGEKSYIDVVDIGRFNTGPLNWLTKENEAKCINTIPKNSGSELICITSIGHIGRFLNGKMINQSQFGKTPELHLSYCNHTSTQIPLGFYFIDLRIDGKIFDEEIRPIYCLLYLYAKSFYTSTDESGSGSFFLHMGIGDPLNDPRINPSDLPTIVRQRNFIRKRFQK